MSRESLQQRLARLKDESTLELTTTGRRTGKRHMVTVWFVVHGQTVYLVTLKIRRDWPRNLMKDGTVELDIAGEIFKGHAKVIADAKRLERVKTRLAKKYWAAWVGSWFGLGPEGAFAVTIES